MYRKIQRIHFVGIGGIGMSGIAEVLINLGYRVSGSDIAQNDITTRLEKIGGNITYHHSPRNIKCADVVVVSSAIPPNNPEVEEARLRKIPVIPRAEMLAELMRLKHGIAVSGTHGKTTTTSMIATVLAHGGIDPTVVIGGKLNSIGSNAKLGLGDFMVVEADESDGSFLKLSPTIAVVTNIDPEHLDYYKDIEHIKDTFLSFINKVPFYGAAILCLDHPNIQSCIPKLEKKFYTYGLNSNADFVGERVNFDHFTANFEVIRKRTSMGRLTINMPGFHNVYNALATIAVATELDIPFTIIAEALENFPGVQRRFQVKGTAEDIMVIDDYGHHPVEIQATLSAAKEGFKRHTIAIFQPHRYTRTKALFDQFVTAFYQADTLIITDIYPAGEPPIPDISASMLSEKIVAYGHKDVTYIPDKEKIKEHLYRITMPGDMVMTLGAGNVDKIGDEFLNGLRKGLLKKKSRKNRTLESENVHNA
ncbi:MAG: UDP-N-acetylmuramate--L-alanine ligase [Thermodesulfobacteriota bacterium]|nr:UDP-N-acetylmuramate--L-alanine ligase [Thermodesulfobacteriota bacterium]